MNVDNHARDLLRYRETTPYEKYFINLNISSVEMPDLSFMSSAMIILKVYGEYLGLFD